MLQENESPPRVYDPDSSMNDPTKAVIAGCTTAVVLVGGLIAADSLWWKPKAQQHEKDAVTFFLNNQNASSSSSPLTEERLRVLEEELRDVREKLRDLPPAAAQRSTQSRRTGRAPVVAPKK